MNSSGLLILIVMSLISRCCIQLSASKYPNELGRGNGDVNTLLIYPQHVVNITCHNASLCIEITASCAAVPTLYSAPRNFWTRDSD
jgi:hypothetical protein